MGLASLSYIAQPEHGVLWFSWAAKFAVSSSCDYVLRSPPVVSELLSEIVWLSALALVGNSAESVGGAQSGEAIHSVRWRRWLGKGQPHRISKSLSVLCSAGNVGVNLHLQSINTAA